MEANCRRRVHLATLYLAVIGSLLSAFFIIVANSWMQHPVGIVYQHGKPVLTNIWAVLTNNTAINAYEHTLDRCVRGRRRVRARHLLVPAVAAPQRRHRHRRS